MLLDKVHENANLYPDQILYADTVHAEPLTNARLYELSGRVYAFLKSKGYGKEDFIMIKLSRGYDFCIAILGVWRAGAAVVGLEDTYAPNRIDYIYKDCGCVFEINKDNWQEILSFSSLMGHEKISLHDAAFAVYTSGSTGNPKGVLHEFGTLERIVEAAYLENGAFIMEDKEQTALFIPLNFVAFYVYLCATLFFGRATAWIVDYQTVRNKKALASFMLSKKINTTFLTPSYVKKLGMTGPFLKKLLVGGEPANGLYKKGVQLFNVYTMSESAYPVSIFQIDKAYDPCPIGTAGNYGKILLLDENGHEVEQGQVGEICFYNPYSRGYINFPEETRKSFVDKLYHTGDLAQKDQNGNICFIGRNNDMVKIDGNRIEPAEVEKVCQKVLKLKECVAKGFESDGVLALYYTDTRKIDAEDARKRLSAFLPYYMIPSRYYQMKELPKNKFGKVMRKELKLVLQKNQDYIAPRNAFEKKLSDAFTSVLGVEEIGIRDDFFSLGGNSLKTIELLSILEEEEISIKLFYEMRTIENISDYIAGKNPPKVLESMEPNAILYGLLRIIGFFTARIVFKRSIQRNEIKDAKGPFVVLANHEAALDFFNLIGMTKRKMVCVMSASYYYTLPCQKLLKKLRFIPKQQFQTEFTDIMQMKNVVEQGLPLVLYPAGIQPTDGISTPISPQTWDLLKLLNADVYIAKTVGTYFVKPKWAQKYRFGKTSLDVFRLFSKEEVQRLSSDEIGDKCDAALYFDAYKDQEKNKCYYRNNTIEGLQNVLYICPKCKKEYTIHLQNSNTLVCTNCGFTQTSDRYGIMKNENNSENEIRLVSDWSRMIKNELRKKIEYGFILSEETIVHTIDQKKHRFVESGRGVLTLDNDFLTLDCELYQQPFTLKLHSNQFPALPVQPGKYLEIQDKQNIYRCYLKNPEKTTQFVDLLSLLHAEKNDRSIQIEFVKL